MMVMVMLTVRLRLMVHVLIVVPVMMTVVVIVVVRVLAIVHRMWFLCMEVDGGLRYYLCVDGMPSILMLVVLDHS